MSKFNYGDQVYCEYLKKSGKVDTIIINFDDSVTYGIVLDDGRYVEIHEILLERR